MLLSVIITCFNYEKYVGRAIRSVLDQQEASVEIIVVDDGSTDNSWEKICSFPVRRFSITNSGQLGACIYGLEQSTGEFILFLDADDELNKGCIPRIIKSLDYNVAKLQYSLLLIDNHGNSKGRSYSNIGNFRSRSDLINQVYKSGFYRTPPTSGNVFRRDLCAVLYAVDYEKVFDGVILFAAPFFGDVVSISDNLGSYRIHDRNQSGLGRRLDPLILDKQIHRFRSRMHHLRAVALEKGYKFDNFNPESLFHLREIVFYRDTILLIKTPFKNSIRLAFDYLHEYQTPMRKLTLFGFFFLSAFLPTRLLRLLVLLRFGARLR